jgi:ubiquinone/menaquinone biosynthesis C-methylase UbiE
MHMPGFNDNSFDAIFTVQSAEHALSMHILMLEFWRILRTGGRWFLDTATQNLGMWQVWHPNLHSHDEWVKFGEVYGFKVAADESTHDRTDLFLEKLPESECVNWRYTNQIYSALSKATNGE